MIINGNYAILHGLSIVLHAAGRHCPLPAAAVPCRAFAAAPDAEEAGAKDYNDAKRTFNAALTGVCC